MGPESIKCKGACINMHRAVQHFHPKELQHKIFYYILFCLFYISIFSQLSSRVSCIRERSDASDCCLWALDSKSDGIVPQKQKVD